MSSVSKIKLPDNTILDIKDGRMGNARIFHGTCSTAGATAAKVVSCADFISAELVKGALIFVTFSYTNSATAADLTMDVNSTGVKSIKKQGNTSSANNLAKEGEIRANSTYLFQYDGTNWVCMTLDYNSTYSALTETDMKAGTATTGRTITAARVKQAVEYWMSQNQVNWNETDSTSPSYLKNKPIISEVFTAIYNVTTLADVVSAYNAGKIMQLSDGGDIGHLQEAYLESGSESFMFSCCVGTKINYYIINSNGWSTEAASMPDAPGTLDTTATTAQSTNSSEDLSGSITLHKVAKTGTYSDLIGTPSIPSAPGTLNTTATTAQSTSASEALSGSVTLHKVSKTGNYNDLMNKVWEKGSGQRSAALWSSLLETYASGIASVANGTSMYDGDPVQDWYIEASGDGSHAEGYIFLDPQAQEIPQIEASILASGDGSHAEGYLEVDANEQGNIYITASGKGAHAEGTLSTASGNYSHAEGMGSYAQNVGEHAAGRYNKSNKANTTWGNAGNTLSSIGIGTSSTRKNALEVMQNGDAYVYGIGTYDGTNPTSGTNDLKTIINGKQATLVSGTNIKTLNGTSLLGSGNITINIEPQTGAYIIDNIPSTFISGGNICVDSSNLNGLYSSENDDFLIVYFDTSIPFWNKFKNLVINGFTFSIVFEDSSRNQYNSYISGFIYDSAEDDYIVRISGGDLTQQVIINDLDLSGDVYFEINPNPCTLVHITTYPDYYPYGEYYLRVPVSSSDISTTTTIAHGNTGIPVSGAVYDEIHPAIASSQPAGGLLPNVLYNLGTISSTTTFSLATPGDSSVANHYYWTFDTSSTAPTITWPSGISWNGGSAPTINASKHYEISVLGGIGAFMEV